MNSVKDKCFTAKCNQAMHFVNKVLIGRINKILPLV